MGNSGPGRQARLVSSSSLRLSIVAPVIAYWLLSRHGVGTVDALAVSAVFPAAGALLTVARSRRADPLAALSLAAIGVGLAAGLLFHDGRLLLVRDSFVTGVLGTAFLGSLFTRKPLIFALRRRLFVPERPGAYDRSWQSQAVRTEARRTTAIWGVALLAEAALRVGLSYLLPAGTLVAISPLLAPLTLGPLAVATLRPRRAARGEAAAAQTGSLPAEQEREHGATAIPPGR